MDIRPVAHSRRADATLTNRSVRRGSPNSAAPKVSTAHASAFCNVSVFIPLSPLLFCAPLFFNVRLPYKCQCVNPVGRVQVRSRKRQEKHSHGLWMGSRMSLLPLPSLHLLLSRSRLPVAAERSKMDAQC